MFKSVPKPVVFTFSSAGDPDNGIPATPNGTITIPAGNWDAYSLQQFLNTTFPLQTTIGDPHTPQVFYDPGTLGYTFEPSLHLTSLSAGAAKLLGIDPSRTSGIVASSQCPVNFSGTNEIRVLMNIPLFNVDLQNVLAVIPVDVPYGEPIIYTDYEGAQSILSTSQTYDDITITLTDQDGVELYRQIPDTITVGSFEYENYIPPWSLVLSFEGQSNPGFSKPFQIY